MMWCWRGERLKWRCRIERDKIFQFYYYRWCKKRKWKQFSHLHTLLLLVIQKQHFTLQRNRLHFYIYVYSMTQHKPLCDAGNLNHVSFHLTPQMYFIVGDWWWEMPLTAAFLHCIFIWKQKSQEESQHCLLNCYPQPKTYQLSNKTGLGLVLLSNFN